MAAVGVNFDGVRLSAAESETDGGTWDKWGATQSPSQETDFVFQGTFAISNKVSNTAGGVDFDATSTTDLETVPRVVLAKVNVTTYGIIDTSVAEGMSYQIGSGGSAYYGFFIFGSEEDYPFAGGWQLLAIDPNVVQYRSETVGSPDLAIADYFGLFADITTSVKSENVVHDALDYFDSGKGITLSGGDGGDADGIFQDFVDFDEGDSNNRFGVVSTREGILYTLGTLSIGSGTHATVFTDSNQVMVFPDARVNTGFAGLHFEMYSSTNAVNISNCSFIGKGTITGAVPADTRPDYRVTGVLGDVVFSASTFNVFREMQLSGNTTLINCTILSGGTIWQSSSIFENCVFSQQTTYLGTASFISDDPSLIDRCNFTANGSAEGHAIELTTSGTFGFNANFFNDYGTDDTSGSAIFNNSGEHITLNITGLGDSPSVRNSTNSVTNINNAVTLTIICLDEDSSPVPNVSCFMLSGTGGSETVLMNELTDGSGEATESFNFPGLSEGVTVRIRRSSPEFGVRFEPVNTVGTITSNGFALTVVMREDPIAD